MTIDLLTYLLTLYVFIYQLIVLVIGNYGAKVSKMHTVGWGDCGF